jgi:hypothetical protein
VAKITLTFVAEVDNSELDSIYTHEDLLVEDLKEHVIYALSRLNIEDVCFSNVDVEGLT